MKVKLFDENLIGQPGLSMYIDPKTDWRRDFEQYDVGIFVDKMCFVVPKDESKINCAWLIEPPIINGENYLNIKKNKENFKYIFTHHKNILNEGENFIFVPHGGTWLREEDISIHEKNKLVSFIFSWKQWNPYHRMRYRVYDRFKDSNLVDFYGTGCEKPIDLKITALKDYMFSIVIENSIENGYFTEKLLDCFLSGTIPIYVGSKSVCDIFDENGIIFFEGDENLPEILSNIDKNFYLSKLSSIQKNFELAQNYMCPEQIIQNFLNDRI